MGLDIVELVMETEKTFRFTIPDEDACKLATVGELYTYVRDHAPGAADDPQLWSRVVDLVERETGAPRKAIRPEASFVYDLHMD
jgi:hypothetical protein